MKSKLFFLVTLLTVLTSPIASAQVPSQHEEITLTTYYPAPFGDYDMVTTNLLGVGTASPSPTTAVDIAPVGVATVNNDVLTAVHIRPTFNDAGFSGVQHNGLLVETGNVGIGTNTPSQRLDVNGGIQLGNVADADSEAGVIRWTGLQFEGHNGAIWAPLGGGSGGDGGWTDDGAVVRLTTATDKVGIGTNSPTEKLEIVGNLFMRGDIKTDRWQKSDTNTFIGVGVVGAGNLQSTGTRNTAVGNRALYSNTSGVANAAIGRYSLYFNTTGSWNTGLGEDTLFKNSTGGSNTALGFDVLSENTTGTDNTAIGVGASTFNTTGCYNTAVGTYALHKQTTGYCNTAVGHWAGHAASGSNIWRNSTFGYMAGMNLTTNGNNNILIGYKAGDSITSGANNIIIGYDVDTPSATTSNHLNIGNLIYGNLSTGRVGIGTTSPGGNLDVNGTIYQRGSQLHADYVFEPGYELESIEEHAEYMWREKHLQAVPKAEVDTSGKQVLEIGAHRRGILEELEKAHVYIQQLNERIRVLEAKIRGLEE